MNNIVENQLDTQIIVEKPKPFEWLKVLLESIGILFSAIVKIIDMFSELVNR